MSLTDQVQGLGDANSIGRYDVGRSKRDTKGINAKVDPVVKNEWNRQKAAAAERMGYDTITSELFISQLLDVYQFHLGQEAGDGV